MIMSECEVTVTGEDSLKGTRGSNSLFESHRICALYRFLAHNSIHLNDLLMKTQMQEMFVVF